MDARQQQRAFNWLLARGYPTAAPIMFRALWLSAAKATKAVPVISVILFYFYKNAQGCQSGIHRIIDVGCLAVRKMQKNIVQTLKQRMTSNRGLTSRLKWWPYKIGTSSHLSASTLRIGEKKGHHFSRNYKLSVPTEYFTGLKKCTVAKLFGVCAMEQRWLLDDSVHGCSCV